MLSQTRVTSEAMCRALHDHFVDGLLQSEAADRNGVARQQFNTQVVKIRTKVKPAFDAYADLVSNAK
ncbi:hypothetical protein [Chromobacterium haemolyticum]|uniref:hypothetical protein n=1 Tax=Chromobacterium haemolyticum TaxID=394935 RepID=UPI00244792F7|nr:hypothetical protein [Chromobacterium haemolyticum]MDH0341996.1 hypothetical protein [Chromobacterium haemolyticum]